MTASTELRASPLAGWADRFAAASAVRTHFAIREVAFSTQINLRGDPLNDAFRAPIELALGSPLPLTPNTCSAGAAFSTLWLGPDEWLVTADTDRTASTCALLRAALKGVHHAVTDVSSNRTIMEIAGADARAVLAKGASLDLHSSQFGPLMCAQTLIAKAPVILVCPGAGDALRVYVRSSLAAYLATWVLDAAAGCAESRELDAAKIAARLV